MVDVIGRAKVIVESQIDKSSIDQSGSKIGSAVKKGALIGVAALGTLAAASVKAVSAFKEGEAQSRKLANVLGNMGKTGAVEEVEKLASSLQKTTGVSDDTIKQGQTLLATFSQVAASAGETGGAFERATKAAVDMASAGFGSVESASVMLGKALQDPLKGVTALGRAGVTFTADQKKLIEGFVAANEVAKAQDLILKEVEKQVGGTAEASVTEGARIKQALGEIQETAGGLIIELFTDDDAKKNQSFADSLFKINDELGKLEKSKSWAALEASVGGVRFALEKIGGVIEGFIEGMMLTGEQTGLLVDDIKEGWEAIKLQVSEDLSSIGNAIRNAPSKWARSAVRGFKSLGRQLFDEFIKGFGGGSFGDIGQKIKDAINAALPDTVTFFGGPGPPPAITVDLPQFANGVRNFRGGAAVVGERGPEVVNLPPGSDVYSNTESAPMLGSSNTFNIYGPVSGADILGQSKWADRFGSRLGAMTVSVVG